MISLHFHVYAPLADHFARAYAHAVRVVIICMYVGIYGIFVSHVCGLANKRRKKTNKKKKRDWHYPTVCLALSPSFSLYLSLSLVSRA